MYLLYSVFQDSFDAGRLQPSRGFAQEVAQNRSICDQNVLRTHSKRLESAGSVYRSVNGKAL